MVGNAARGQRPKRRAAVAPATRDARIAADARLADAP